MQQSKNSILEAGAKFLSDPKILGRLPQEIQNGIASGKKEFALAEFYTRKKLTGLAGIVDFIKDADVLKAGVTNLDRGRLPIDVYMALVSVQVNYAYHASSTEVTAAVYANSDVNAVIPIRIKNSEIRIKNGNRPLLEVRTQKFISNNVLSGSYAATANEENSLVLPQPKLLLPKSLLKVEFEFADDAVAVPANNHFMEVVFMGVKIVDRVEA